MHGEPKEWKNSVWKTTSCGFMWKDQNARTNPNYLSNGRNKLIEAVSWVIKQQIPNCSENPRYD